MSYTGAIGSIMSGSGLQEQWETMYAPNSVRHMLTGHAYVRALRGHMLTATAVVHELLDKNASIGELRENIKSLHQSLLKHECADASVLLTIW